MNLIKQPNEWTCLACSFAMVMDLSYDKIIEQLGHDGSTQVRGVEVGHHEQELIDLSINLGCKFTLIEAFPCSILDEQDPHEYMSKEQAHKRLDAYMRNNIGVIVCTVGFNKPHAVAWDGDQVLDPSKNDWKISDLNILGFYLLNRY